MSGRIPLLRVYETREEKRVFDKENRRIVTHEIPDTFLSVEFYSESTWISKKNNRMYNNKQIDNNQINVRKNFCVPFLSHIFRHLNSLH